MKLCVANLARADLTPRPAEVMLRTRSTIEEREPLGARMRQALSSLFDEEEDLPTTLYAR